MIKYNVTGNANGEVLIFINGAGIGPWMWDDQVRYFTDYKCITFDLPGHGANINIDFTTIEDCSNTIKDIILKESVSKKATLIGHSIGSQITMYMLEHHENVIDRAVIISGLNKPMPFMNMMIKPMIACSMPLVKRRYFAKIQANQLSVPDKMFDVYYKDTIKISKETFSNILNENSNFIFSNSSQTQLKTMILVGDNEKNIMKISAKKTKSLIANSIGYIVKNASHDIPYVQDGLLNNLIESFIDGKDISHDELIKL